MFLTYDVNMLKLFSTLVFIPLLMIITGPALDHHFAERNGTHPHAHSALAHANHDHEFEHSHSHSTKDRHAQTEYAASSVITPVLSINQANSDGSQQTTQTNANLSSNSGEPIGNSSLVPSFSETPPLPGQISSPVKNPPRSNA